MVGKGEGGDEIVVKKEGLDGWKGGGGGWLERGRGWMVGKGEGVGWLMRGEAFSTVLGNC